MSRKQVYTDFIVYDFESYLKTIEINDDEFIATKFVNEHVPVSCCIASSQSEVLFICEESCEILTEKFFNSALKLAKPIIVDMLQKFSSELASLDNALQSFEKDSLQYKFIQNLKGQLYGFCRQVPIIGFNSGRYDVQLFLKYLIPYLHKEFIAFTTIPDGSDNNEIYKRRPEFCPHQISNIIKQGPCYSSISTPNLHFLDISKFLAPGTSYDSMVKAYGCTLQKSFFPYTYFKSMAVLSETAIPPYAAYFNDLKNQNSLEIEFTQFQRLNALYGEKCALATMNLENVPKTGAENYNDLKVMWLQYDWNFKSYLEYYNRLDVEPFRECVQKMIKYYQTNSINLLKDAMSVPGIARLLVFASVKPGIYFTLFQSKDSDLFHKFSENSIGGPSIIFKRLVIAGTTQIRDGEETVARVIGLDANALYLYSFSLAMPVGCYIRRRAEDNFRIERSDQFMKEVDWLDYLVANDPKLDIIHQCNGRQYRVANFHVDGYDTLTNTVFEFLGCYVHGCDCKKSDDDETEVKRLARKKQTEERLQFIRSHTVTKCNGDVTRYNVIVMKECDFDSLVCTNPLAKSFTRRRQSVLPYIFSSTETGERRIIESIKNDQLFGMVECDIHVPEHLYDYFDELTPIFRHASVKPEHWSPYMSRLAEKLGLDRKPRDCLIGAMSAKKQLFSTPLLKWYLNKGLVITKVYEVIEYQKNVCFTEFVDNISNARREGDADSEKACLADLAKLIGNSSYGSMLLNKMKHRNTIITSDIEKVLAHMNNPRFRNLNELGNDVFELEMGKSSISLNQPTQIGFHILQLAKLRMLEFYYDFFDKYISRKHFELIEMDTDSLYFALSSRNMDSLVRPELLAEYQAEKYKWFPRTCKTYKAFDRRKPGLFKVEAEGSKMVALCSKSYCLADDETGAQKFSAKGCNKNAILDPWPLYHRALVEEMFIMTTNRGFRNHDGKIKTYYLEKRGLSPFDVKRFIKDDGISTTSHLHDFDSD